MFTVKANSWVELQNRSRFRRRITSFVFYFGPNVHEPSFIILVDVSDMATEPVALVDWEDGEILE